MRRMLRLLARWVCVLGPVAAGAQQPSVAPEPSALRRSGAAAEPVAAAPPAEGALRIAIDLAERRLWVVRWLDTLRTADVGVGRDTSVAYDGRVWSFVTPRGVRTVLRKVAGPIWVAPDWHYVEVAAAHRLQIVALQADRPTPVGEGRRLETRRGRVGIAGAGSGFTPLAAGEEIILGDTLFIPPPASRNRQVAGQLGRYALDLGDGYMLHGTPDQASVGRASTHGCIRLRDDDIAWLYENVPVGTPVYIY